MVDGPLQGQTSSREGFVLTLLLTRTYPINRPLLYFSLSMWSFHILLCLCLMHNNMYNNMNKCISQWMNYGHVFSRIPQTIYVTVKLLSKL